MRSRTQTLAYCEVVKLMERAPAADLLSTYVDSTLQPGEG
jgi:hypothetical protein